MSKKETLDKLEEKKVKLITYKKKNQVPNTSEKKQILKKRYKVENVFATLKSYKRILLRHEKKSDNYLEFIYLGCIFQSQRIFLETNIFN